MRRHLFVAAVIYVICHHANGDFALSYEGMPKATVIKLVESTFDCPYEIVKPDRYNVFIATHTQHFK